MAGKIGSENTIQFTDGKSLSFEEAKIQIEETGYETYNCRFMDVIDEEFISLQVKADEEIYLSVKELNKLGWYLLGDCQLLKKHSGKVLGYYPRFKENPTSADDKYPINVYKTHDDSKKPILIVSGEAGYFLVEDVVYLNSEYWVKITYEYYTGIPCTDEKIAPRPSVKGWIKLYDNGSLLKSKVLFHYSRGC